MRTVSCSSSKSATSTSPPGTLTKTRSNISSALRAASSTTAPSPMGPILCVPHPLPLHSLTHSPSQGPTITCNTGGNTPSSLTTSIAAGSQVSFLWTPWESDHPGPVMTYMARCPGKCSAFKGDTGNVWFKIDQSGYDASFAVPWASKRLYTLNRYILVVLHIYLSVRQANPNPNTATAPGQSLSQKASLTASTSSATKSSDSSVRPSPGLRSSTPRATRSRLRAAEQRPRRVLHCRARMRSMIRG